MFQTESVLKVFPSAGNGTSVTPNASSGAWSTPVDLFASAATDLVITSLIYSAPINGPQIIEASIYINSVDHIVPIALQGYTWNGTNRILLSIPLEVTAGQAVQIRMRKTGTSVLAWTFGIEYYEAPVDGSIVSTAKEIKSTQQISITPSGTDWSNSAWVQVTASAAADLVIGGITVIGPNIEVQYEFDIGIGAAASEVVKTTIPGMQDFASVVTIQEAGMGYYYPLRPLLDAIPSGSRVAVRMRKAGTSTSVWGFNIHYLEKPIDWSDWTTTKVQKCVPSAANATQMGTTPDENTFGSWIEFIPSAAADLAITGLIAYEPQIGSGGWFQIEIAIGAAGFEVPIYRCEDWAATSAWYGDNFYIPVMRQFLVLSGQRVSVRWRGDVSGTLGCNIKLLYIEDPDYLDNILENGVVSQTLIGDTTPETITFNTTPWGNSNWAQVSAPTPTNYVLTALFGFVQENGIDCEIDLGLGASPTVLSTIRFNQSFESARVGKYEFPFPLYIPTGSLLSIRIRKSGTAAGTTKFYLYGTEAPVSPSSIRVRKVTVPASAEIFDFTTENLDPVSFSLSNGEEQDFLDLTPGDGYVVEETPKDGWITTYEVSNGSPHDDIEVIEGEQTLVTVTNTRVTRGSGIFVLPLSGPDTGAALPPGSAKTDDDFITEEGELIQVKIPDPFIETGFIKAE